MTDETIVPQEDVKKPASDQGAVTPEKPEEKAEATTEKPDQAKDWQAREQELQRAVGAANTARRKLERDLAEERLKWEKANQRLEELAKRLAPKEPDPAEDPVGGLLHETRATREEVAALKKAQDEARTVEQQRQAQQQFIQTFDAHARAFAAKQPDFLQAQAHLYQDTVETFVESGYTPEQAHTVAQQWWFDIVGRALNEGADPAERIYKLARKRGYKAQNGEAKVDAINKGQAAAKSLSAAGGTSPKQITAETIATMSDEEFAKLSEKDFQRAFGG